MSEEKKISTLRVLHLPPGLPDELREELFKHYGAVKTRTIRKSAKYTITFVEFPSPEHATEVCLRLHQLEVNGRRLSVEYAKKNISDEKIVNEEDPEPSEDTEADNSKKNFQEFLKELNSWAPQHLLSQPPPPNLKYKYPKPTKTILLRIAIQLVKEPAFYTQVLHLMNKMNLLPPFDGLDEEYPILKEVYDIEKYKHLFEVSVESKNVEVTKEQEEEQEKQKEEQSEEESEMESDKESGFTQEVIIPEKRKKPQSKKRLKIPKFVNPLKQFVAPSTGQKQKPEDIFEVPTVARNKKIVLKPAELTNKVLDSASNVEGDKNWEITSSSTEGFGLITPANKDEEVPKEPTKLEFITTEQLHDNRISTNDQRVLPVFKNYHPGKPSNRLYIKNLAKQVEESDLHFIYRRYVLPSSSGSELEYNVRLMQEGRMKGQAFITLPNIAQAQLALDETNGYILKDKPMVVQFAKVAKT